MNYGEIVPYVLTGLDICDFQQPAASPSPPPRLVESNWLPKLYFEPTEGLWLPLLNQLYMTDHLSYGGVLLAVAGMDPLWAARAWHALFGMVLIWLLYDVARLLGFRTRVALLGVATAATSLQITSCYAPARFDESLASFGSVGVLWAVLHHARDGRQQWVWAGVFIAALAVSAKLTALWSLLGLAVAGALAGWRPPPLRRLRWPLVAAAPLFAPLAAFALMGPAAGVEIGRQLGSPSDLFTSDVIPGTAANLIKYLGSWGSIIGEILSRSARSPNQIDRLLVVATLLWLLGRALAPGAAPRRRRLETRMLAFISVIFAFVLLFHREHRDYQFVLLVPLWFLATAAFLEWGTERVLDHRLPAWAVALVIFSVPVGSNLREQRGLHEDLTRARNAMVNLGVQTASAAWLLENAVLRPIVTTFYAVGATSCSRMAPCDRSTGSRCSPNPSTIPFRISPRPGGLSSPTRRPNRTTPYCRRERIRSKRGTSTNPRFAPLSTRWLVESALSRSLIHTASPCSKSGR